MISWNLAGTFARQGFQKTFQTGSKREYDEHHGVVLERLSRSLLQLHCAIAASSQQAAQQGKLRAGYLRHHTFVL